MVGYRPGQELNPARLSPAKSGHYSLITGPARPDCDQQQRARSLKSGPSWPGWEPDHATSEGRLWMDDHQRQSYQYAWQGAILREN